MGKVVREQKGWGENQKKIRWESRKTRNERIGNNENNKGKFFLTFKTVLLSKTIRTV